MSCVIIKNCLITTTHIYMVTVLRKHYKGVRQKKNKTGSDIFLPKTNTGLL